MDDNGNPMEVSSDPLLPVLQAQLAGIEMGNTATVDGKLEAILSNTVIFGVDLVKAGLSQKIIGYVKEMLHGNGAVRRTLQKYLA